MTPQQPSETSGSRRGANAGPMEVCGCHSRTRSARRRLRGSRRSSAEDVSAPRAIRGGKVCQACGEIATYVGERGEAAGHVNGGEFVGFAGGHESCQFVPPPGARRRRPFRFCEICQEQVPAVRSRRFTHSWLCEGCEGRIEAADGEVESVLLRLRVKRYAAYRELPAHARGGKEIPNRRDDLFSDDAVEPPALEGWLPPGLSICEVCDAVRGTTPAAGPDGFIELKSTCFCEGLVCSKCGKRRRRRPISDFYVPGIGAWIHVPYFAAMRKTCDACTEPTSPSPAPVARSRRTRFRLRRRSSEG